MRSISCVFSVFLKNVAVDMNQRYFLLIKDIFMKLLMKQLFSSLFIAGAMLSTQALAEEKTSEQAQPQTQVQQQTAVQAPSQTVQQTVSDKLNINTASASDIQKALIGIGAKKAEAIVQYREKHGNFTVAEQLLEVQGIGKATLEKNRDRIVF